MTIGKKLIGGYAIVLALLALLAIAIIVAINALQQTRTTYDAFLDVNAKQVNYADDLRFELRDQVAHYRAMLDKVDQFHDRPGGSLNPAGRATKLWPRTTTNC